MSDNDGVRLVMIHDLTNPATGKTYKEENLERQHQIPVGTLVEVKYDRWYGDGACEKVHARLWVVEHRRDCDGTPLYALSHWRDPAFALSRTHRSAEFGFAEKGLAVVGLTAAVQRGDGALEWDQEAQ